MYPPLGHSDQVAVSVSIDFSSNSKQDSLFHHIAYDYSRADWDSPEDHLRDAPWEDIFKVSASTAAKEFCQRVQVGSDVSFSCLCCSHTYREQHKQLPFFFFYQLNKSSKSKASNHCKRVAKAA